VKVISAAEQPGLLGQEAKDQGLIWPRLRGVQSYRLVSTTYLVRIGFIGYLLLLKFEAVE
jgi:hypothetical protein